MTSDVKQITPEREKAEKEMLEAIKYGTVDDVKKALKKVKAGEALMTNPAENTPLHLAAYNGEPEKLEVMLKSLKNEEKAEAVNKTNKFGWTPLTDALYPIQPIESYKKEARKSGVSEEKIAECERWYNNRFNNLSKTVLLLLGSGANPFPSNSANRNGNDGPAERLGLRDIVDLGVKACGEGSFEAKALKKAENEITIAQCRWHLFGFAKQYQ